MNIKCLFNHRWIYDDFRKITETRYNYYYAYSKELVVNRPMKRTCHNCGKTEIFLLNSENGWYEVKNE